MNFLYPHARLLIFAKAPFPGQVKTRLIPYLGEAAAARLQQQLIERTVAMACRAAVAPVELWLAGKDSHPCIQGVLGRFAISVRPQQGADLGERMYHAAAAALQEVERVVIIGTDSPAMDSATLQQAFAALDGDDLVFGPAEDGGYTLIGMKRPWSELFGGIEWGSEMVLQQSMNKAEALGLSVSQLGMGWDLDRPEDYRRALSGGWIQDVE